MHTRSFNAAFGERVSFFFVLIVTTAGYAIAVNVMGLRETEHPKQMDRTGASNLFPGVESRRYVITQLLQSDT
jgi:hypothetical protein